MGISFIATLDTPVDLVKAFKKCLFVGGGDTVQYTDFVS